MSDQVVLVDSSVWIDYFRNGLSDESKALDHLLSVGLAVICAPIKAEVVSGAVTRPDFIKLEKYFKAVVNLEAGENIWNAIEESRFSLARKGVQASLIDLWIATVAVRNNALILTLDDDFYHLKKVLPIEFYLALK